MSARVAPKTARGQRPLGPRGLTMIEIVVVSALLVSILYVLYVMLMRDVGEGGGGPPSFQAARAAHYVAGRLRRDIRWARSASLEREGKVLTLQGPNEERRVYEYVDADHVLRIPDIGSPSRSEVFRRCTFRRVEFIQPTPRTVKFVLAAFPGNFRIPLKANKQDREMTTVLVGEGCLRGPRDQKEFPYWNR